MRPLLVCALFNVEGIELTDPPCRPANLILALNNLVDALTGLERILTTPIPYSSVTLLKESPDTDCCSQIFSSSMGCHPCLLFLFGALT